MIRPDLSLELPETIGSLHFVGIGGSGMSGIARMFVEAGHRVTGSDRADNPYIASLRELGVPVAIGHDAANLGDADTVVVTGALWEDNPEYQRALAEGRTILHRSQALAWLTRGRRLVSVAGAHGKTTSTGMLVTALRGLGEDPSFVSGGVLAGIELSAAPGAGDLFVIEADESDGSFLLYDTAVALITNAEAEHLDFYPDEEAYLDAFARFASAARELVVINPDDPGNARILERLGQRDPGATGAGGGATGPRIVTFGRGPDAQVRLLSARSAGGSVSFELAYRGERHAGSVPVPGEHNAVNAAGVFAVLTALGREPEAVLRALAGFGGTHRRFELRGEVGGVRVYDDYAHHPTEVDAVLSAARTVHPEGRIIAVHQPHLYSRTRIFAGEFAEVLEHRADQTVVLEICGAREDPEPGVTGELVSSRFDDPTRVSYQPEWDRAAQYVARISRPGDVVITLGCGDVYRIVPQVLDALRARSA